MAGFTDYVENALLNWLKGVTFPAAPAAVYVGLFSAAPSDAGGGTEVTTTIRVAGRVAATFGSIGAGSGTASQIANNAIVDFGTAAGGATVTHFGIFDAASAGNLLGWAALSTPQTVSANNVVSFAASALTVSED